ncbi:MAG TPA: GNAT family N-acetyltransferase [Tepidisphaeraceae bacterium]|nr:GNAT family N-acetyltransferase [Tepidisphaeraceae bacterium]
MAVQLPAPRVPIAIRTATMDDLPFLDELQKQHSKALGFFPRAQMEGYVENGWVLIAEDAATKQRLGYCASRDRYLKRDELGVIYQLCVAPGQQRGLIGATLVKEVFERAAYGCRLFCCWCAQDLEANYFWESMGFVPIAFRAGSTGKKRVHIFWQRRIVEGDATPWWYPFKTDSGAIREDRVVFPIPPGVHWSEVRKVELPARSTGLQPVLPEGGHGLKTRAAKVKAKPATAGPGPGKVGILVGGRIKYVDRPGYVAPKPAKAERKKAAKGPAVKIDPAYLSRARELRDRYLEHVNGERVNDQRGLAGWSMQAKYEVGRVLAGAPDGRATHAARALPAPAAA